MPEPRRTSLVKQRADAGKKRGPQRCPACGGSGHNRRTCKGVPGGVRPVVFKADDEVVAVVEQHELVITAAVHVPPPAEVARAVRTITGRLCGICRKPGHRRETCEFTAAARQIAGVDPAPVPPSPLQADDAPAPPGRARKPPTCRTCGTPGHTARGCPTTPRAPSAHADRAGRIAERARLAGLVRTPCAECGRAVTHADGCSEGLTRCTVGCGALLRPAQVAGHECEPVELRREA